MDRSSRRPRLAAALPVLATLVALLAAPIGAQTLVPAGAEFLVNTTTADTQHSPSVAGLMGGGYVVTWASWNQDGSAWDVYGQVYDASAAPVGAEFRANTTTYSYQNGPSVAALAGGGFVVTWQSIGQDGSGAGVYGQVYDGSGAPVGAEFRANTYTTNDQFVPSAAALAGGGFVVTWQSIGQDGSDYGVYGQRYDGSGAAVGAEFLVNTTTASDQRYPSVAGLAGGGFVVTWQSIGQDGSGAGVYGQRYDASGAAVGAEFQANTYTTYNQANPSVAGLEGVISSSRGTATARMGAGRASTANSTTRSALRSGPSSGPTRPQPTSSCGPRRRGLPAAGLSSPG